MLNNHTGLEDGDVLLAHEAGGERDPVHCGQGEAARDFGVERWQNGRQHIGGVGGEQRGKRRARQALAEQVPAHRGSRARSGREGERAPRVQPPQPRDLHDVPGLSFSRYALHHLRLPTYDPVSLKI